MSGYQNNSIFWVETEKISANPFQPRREFSEEALNDLADSIRQYGVLQPLVVTRKEEETESGGYSVYYELIAGERRLRASRLAGLKQVPVIIRKQTDDKVRLELAIIENLQREDLNPIDRALAFEQLHKQFKLTHAEIGKRMGKSRVYVSNSIRLLSLPEDMREGLISGKITEGHTRPLLMLTDKPDEQSTLFKEIILKKMSVRDSEKIARKIAQDRVRKKEFLVDPRIRDYEVKLSENLGTRVQIEQKEHGGKITIDYFTLNDIESILASLQKEQREKEQKEHSLEKENNFDFLSGQVSVLGAQQKEAALKEVPTSSEDSTQASHLEESSRSKGEDFSGEDMGGDVSGGATERTDDTSQQEYSFERTKENAPEEAPLTHDKVSDRLSVELDQPSFEEENLSPERTPFSDGSEDLEIRGDEISSLQQADAYQESIDEEDLSFPNLKDDISRLGVDNGFSQEEVQVEDFAFDKVPQQETSSYEEPLLQQQEVPQYTPELTPSQNEFGQEAYTHPQNAYAEDSQHRAHAYGQGHYPNPAPQMQNYQNYQGGAAAPIQREEKRGGFFSRLFR